MSALWSFRTVLFVLVNIIILAAVILELWLTSFMLTAVKFRDHNHQ
jgi:hypothetical protein